MNVSMNADWARFKALGIQRLGRRGFAEWLQHASATMHAEANIEDAARRQNASPPRYETTDDLRAAFGGV